MRFAIAKVLLSFPALLNIKSQAGKSSLKVKLENQVGKSMDRKMSCHRNTANRWRDNGAKPVSVFTI